MNRLPLTLLSALFLALHPPLFAIPTQLTYQGTLKEQSIPVNGTKPMQFRITNQNGTQVYWSSPSMPVNVINGLFSVTLDPTGVNWESVTPFIEVSVNGQLLLPREPLNTSIYSSVAATVVDGAITPTKVAAGYGLVPSGMVSRPSAEEDSSLRSE